MRFVQTINAHLLLNNIEESFDYLIGGDEIIEKEIWKDIKNYEGLYQVSNLGRVKSVDRIITMKNDVYINNKVRFQKGKILQPHISNHGHYLALTLCKNNKRHTKRVHRLVAETFIPNPDNLPEVNHIDGDKFNNTVKNLEWCTDRQNKDHAKAYDLYSHTPKVQTKPVLQIKDGVVINKFESIAEAGRATGLNTSNIGQCCKKKKNHSHVGGYQWEYVNK